MKNNKKTAVLIAAVVSLTCTILFVACNKENTAMTTLNNFSDSPKTEIINPKNPNNPLDSIGTKHNQYLNDVLTYINCNYINPNDLTSDEVLDIYQNYLLENGYTETEIELAFQTITDGYNLSNNVNQYINSLQDSISIIPNESYTNYKELVIRYEKRIMEDSSIDSIEEGTLLAYTSVLRHSMYFWYEEQSKELPKWLKIAGADAAGAATGFAGGASLGWGGAIVGGIIAGAGKSIEKAEKLNELEKPTTDSTSTGLSQG